MQNIQTLLLLFFRNIINHIGGWCTRTCREDKAVAHVEIDVGNQLHRFLEVFGGFAREADDEVRADLNIRARRTQFTDDRFVLQRRMGTSHQVQNAIGTALYRQVQEAHQLRRVAIHFDDIVGEFDRMAGGKANTIDPVDGGNQTQQIGKRSGGAVVVLTTPGIHILTEQVDFTHALSRKLGDLKQNIVGRTAYLFTTGVRHHAVGAIFIAAFHDGDKRGRPFGARFWQTVKLLDFREADIYNRAAVAAHGVDHLRQAVQRLRPKNNIDIVGALANVLAFLRCHAAADADNQVWILLF